MGVGNNKKPLLLIYPGQDGGGAAPHVRYAVYMSLTTSDGTEAGNLGQLVVSGGRLIGMMTHGAASGTKLNEARGSVYAFAVDRSDIQSARQKTKWTGRVAGVVIESREDHDPGFVLEVMSVVGALSDTGHLNYGLSFADLVNSMTPG